MELMRGLAFIALLFAGSAVGAELRQAEVCGDGTTHQSGYCPAVLSSASCSATGATTGSCSATSDEADGTRYVCATSNNTALTGAEIEACSGGAAIAGSSAAETGSNSVSLSGLTTDAAHYGQIVNESPEGWYSNRLVSSSFTPEDNAGTNQARIESILTAVGTTIPFAFNYPSDPVTTSSATVTPATFSANNVNGREITLSAGNYGNISLSGSDKDIIIQPGVVINTLTISSGTRIRVSGESPRVGTIAQFQLAVGGPGPSDIMIDGVNVENGDARIYMGSTRAAIINSKLDVGTGTFAGSAFGGDTNYLFLANNQMVAPGTSDAVTRFQGIENWVFLRNNVVSAGNFGLFRIHAEQTSDPAGSSVENVYVAFNQFEGSRAGINDDATGTPPATRIYNVWFEDNVYYHLTTQDVFINTYYDSYVTGNNGPIEFLSLKRNTGYTDSADAWVRDATPASELQDNTISPLETPPAWSHL